MRYEHLRAISKLDVLAYNCDKTLGLEIFVLGVALEVVRG